MHLRRWLLACALAAAPSYAFAAGANFLTGSGERIMGSVMEYSPDGINALPAGANGQSLPVTEDGSAATYSATGTVTPVVGIVGEICGSASLVIRVKSILINGWAATAGGMTVTVHRLSSADTGGTPVALNKPAYVTTDAAASALAQLYSVAPSSGTSLGSLNLTPLNFPVLGTPFNQTQLLPGFGQGGGSQALTLGAAAQCVDITLGGTLPTTPSISIAFVWTEASQ